MQIPSSFGDALEPGRDVDAVAHQIAVRLLDDIAQMNADSQLDALLGRDAFVAFGHAVLHFDRAAHGVDHAAELDDEPVAGALEDAAVVDRDGRVDEVAAQRPEPRQRAILVRAREPAEADDVGGEDRCNFPGLAHGASRLPFRLAQNRPRIGTTRKGCVKAHRTEHKKTRNHCKPAGRPSRLLCYSARRVRARRVRNPEDCCDPGCGRGRL